MPPFPKTLHAHVTTIINACLKRAEDAIKERKLDAEAAERLRVKEHLNGLEAAIKAIARQIDRREAKEANGSSD